MLEVASCFFSLSVIPYGYPIKPFFIVEVGIVSSLVHSYCIDKPITSKHLKKSCLVKFF